MNDVVVVLGLPLFSLTAPLFVLAGAFAIFAYERAEARARRASDERWLVVSLVLALALGLVVELRPSDGFRGVAWLVLRGVLGCGALGFAELVLLAVGRWQAASAPRRSKPLGA